ncbi:MAG: hypothetical protein HFE64_01030 [Lachnospiraceae bacterium]|nr:hypothetical protein [Lachnospiraceae bacterium]
MSRLDGGIFSVIVYYKKLANGHFSPIFELCAMHGGKNSAISPISASGGGRAAKRLNRRKDCERVTGRKGYEAPQKQSISLSYPTTSVRSSSMRMF